MQIYVYENVSVRMCVCVWYKLWNSDPKGIWKCPPHAQGAKSESMMLSRLFILLTFCFYELLEKEKTHSTLDLSLYFKIL